MNLEVFDFELVTIDPKGKKIKSKSCQGECFAQELGNEVNLAMVLIPGGSFLMGSPTTEKERYSNESPQHKVKITPFFLAKYPITQSQWRAVASLPSVNRSLNPAPSSFKGDELPVECVSWYDAKEFCDRLKQKTGNKYRLPSEAEWEYACRAGTTTPFHFGETITPQLGNYFSNLAYGKGETGKYSQQTTRVGNFKVANAFGIYDLHGNVAEWCADGWHENYQNAPTDGSVWESKEDELRVVRGGSWVSTPRSCRAAFRTHLAAFRTTKSCGFRVALSL